MSAQDPDALEIRRAKRELGRKRKLLADELERLSRALALAGPIEAAAIARERVAERRAAVAELEHVLELAGARFPASGGRRGATSPG